MSIAVKKEKEEGEKSKIKYLKDRKDLSKPEQFFADCMTHRKQ